MLFEGGDTDTNAAIVGGLFGALVGYKGLPQEWKEKIMSFDCVP
jgi:ADP-ribosylglycohydrolase